MDSSEDEEGARPLRPARTRTPVPSTCVPCMQTGWPPDSSSYLYVGSAEGSVPAPPPPRFDLERYGWREISWRHVVSIWTAHDHLTLNVGSTMLKKDIGHVRVMSLIVAAAGRVLCTVAFDDGDDDVEASKRD